MLRFRAGCLPPGEYPMTVEELRGSILVNGPTDGSRPNWDAAWRARLVDNLEVLAEQLWKVGIGDIFVDGSFVEEKDHPNDIDGYFVCELKPLATGELERELNRLDPERVWTWDLGRRRFQPGYPEKAQLPMWHVYRVELYPHVGQLSGIRDRYGNELEFPAAFRRTRTGKPKGIVRLVR